MLPKLNEVKYELEIPSTNEKIDYRPFLVKEQKILMMAEESGETGEIEKAFADIVRACTFEKIDPYAYPMFDVEFIFLRVRSKSVGSEIEVNVPIPNTDPDGEDEYVATTINMDDIDVMMEEDHTNVIKITDKVTIVMSYPTLASMGIIDNLEVPETDRIFQLIKSCIMEVHTGEDVVNAVDVTEKELTEFIDSMTSDQLEKVSEFFATMPKVATMVKVKKGRKTHEVELSGLQSFFG